MFIHLTPIVYTLLEERKNRAQVQAIALQQTFAWYHNNKVKLHLFVKGDLVLPRVFLNMKDTSSGVLGPNWEEPYKVEGIWKYEIFDFAAF